MKLTYSAPTVDVKEFAQFENVFTWCNKVGDSGKNKNDFCTDITGSGYASDRPANVLPKDSAAFDGGSKSGC